MNRLIKKILKEELQGQEFIDHHYSELDRLEGMKDQIIDYLHSEFPNLLEVETRMKKVTYYLPYAEFGKPFKTSDHINY